MEIENLYRSSPITERSLKSTVPVNDELDYSTLKEVVEALDNFQKALYSDFNAFDMSETSTPEELLLEVKARKRASALVAPLIDFINSKLSVVDSKGA